MTLKLCTCRPDPAAQQPAAGDHDRDCARLVFPNLITHVATIGATVSGNQMTGAIDDALAAKNLAPAGTSQGHRCPPCLAP